MPGRRWLALVSLVLVAALAAGGPGAPADAKTTILNVASKEPDTLDPHAALLGQTQAIVRFLFRGLTKFAVKDGRVTTAEVEPDLAQSWTVSDDGTVWTFALRKGVQFHKGFGEMTAEDVKFSFERQLARGKNLKYAKNLDVIKTITVVDPSTVRITLKGFDPVFPLRMAGYQQGYIISKKAAEQFGDKFGWNPVGTGPFAFERHVPRDRVVLRAHAQYHAGKPAIDRVNWFDVPEDATKLIGLEKGTFDVIQPEAVTSDVEAQVKKMGAVLDRRGPGGQVRFYLNMTKKPFDDIRVRLALMHAIDRQAIKDTLYPGDLARLSPSPVPPGYFGHIPVELPRYDPPRAKRLLAEAGYPDGLQITNYFITKSFFYPKVMVLVQEQLKKAGIDLDLQLVEHATYHQNIRKNLNPFVLYGGTRLTDADVWLGLFFHSREIPDPATGNKGANFAHYRGIDDLLAQGRSERDPQKRASLYAEAQRRIVKDAVCLPVVDVPGFSARNPKRVSTPFSPDHGEFALHYFYNYPELLRVRD